MEDKLDFYQRVYEVADERILESMFLFMRHNLGLDFENQKVKNNEVILMVLMGCLGLDRGITVIDLKEIKNEGGKATFLTTSITFTEPTSPAVTVIKSGFAPITKAPFWITTHEMTTWV